MNERKDERMNKDNSYYRMKFMKERLSDNMKVDVNTIIYVSIHNHAIYKFLFVIDTCF